MSSDQSALLRHLSRRTSGRKFIPEVDGFRFLAISWVFIYHVFIFVAGLHPARFDVNSGGLLGRISAEGHFGVELFFVLSGFVLAQPFASHALLDTKPVRLGAYFWRRVTRLEPPYIVSLILLAGVAILLRGWTIAQTIPQFFSSLFYFHNIAYGQHPFLNPVGWSLEVEIQFYILVPALALVFNVRNPALRRAVLLGSMAASMVAQALWVPPPLPFSQIPLGLTIVNFIQFFLAGFLVADIYLTKWRSKPDKNLSWDLVGLFAVIGLVATVQSLAWVRTVAPFLALLLLCAAFRGRYLSRFLSKPWIYTIGGMCYSIYLIHFPVIWGLGRITFYLTVTRNLALNLVIQIVLLSAIVLVAASIFFVLIERPCMDKEWPRKVASWLKDRQRFVTSPFRGS